MILAGDLLAELLPKHASAASYLAQGIVPERSITHSMSAVAVPAAMAWWEFEELPSPISDMLCV